ncbi:hypothetical protein E2C01_016081 [Portunus trituberculatus]|uniref:Uncharacterized protein n=1 Tax=Portunus trituberculatus TaxID=210409 RepID=A0A5B7DPS9_PORTR|nr:hypothetical protein [Portunus trituberculatus]
MQLEEAQKQNIALQRQLNSQMSVNHSQQEEPRVTSVTIQHIHQHQSCSTHQPVYPVLPQLQHQPEAPKPQIQQEKEAAAAQNTSHASAPNMEDLAPTYEKLRGKPMPVLSRLCICVCM